MEGNFGYAMNTIADQVSALMGDNGQVFKADDGRSFEEVCEGFGALIERGRSVWNEETQSFEAYAEPGGDLVRYIFNDGSAIVVSNGAWELEGDTPFSWSGLL